LQQIIGWFMNIIILITLFFILFAFEFIYFKIADKYNIIDKPNHRSSHTQITIRGGGIIFPVAVLLWFIFSDFQYPFFVTGLLLISVISFIDDMKDISRRLRMLIHLLAVTLAFWQLHLFAISWIWVIPGYFVFIGIINAYNFMDGINGITGGYSTILFLTLLWINKYQVQFVDQNMLLIVIMGLLVFNFFNFRKKAICFAGDIGSISISFIICFLLAKLILKTTQPLYILLLLVYGLDAVFTIIILAPVNINSLCHASTYHKCGLVVLH
jgi:UDP-GlcNAc:undecaprenyl-phosphate GlcNAc-1-phosphate transferase